jgi:serine/threonine protein kinase
LKDFLSKMASVLKIFCSIGIVHADLKPDNILVDFDEDQQILRSLKVIDFGSSFILDKNGRCMKEQKEFAMSTPEYLPPEIQTYLARKFTS